MPTERTLRITGDTGAAWELLGELAGLYGDNGGDPDGNAWLPMMPLTEEDDFGVTDVLQDGLGEIVIAGYYDDDEIAEVFGIHDLVELARTEGDWEAVKDSVDEYAEAWAHYGAYGGMDSQWVIIR